MLSFDASATALGYKAPALVMHGCIHLIQPPQSHFYSPVFEKGLKMAWWSNFLPQRSAGHTVWDITFWEYNFANSVWINWTLHNFLTKQTNPRFFYAYYNRKYHESDGARHDGNPSHRVAPVRREKTSGTRSRNGSGSQGVQRRPRWDWKGAPAKARAVKVSAFLPRAHLDNAVTEARIPQ